LTPLQEFTPTTCSLNTQTAATLTITNKCAATTLELFWVNYGCNESAYGKIMPGTSFTQNTYKTHPWRLRNAVTGELLVDIPALTKNTKVTFP
jgi:hypothetical protein